MDKKRIQSLAWLILLFILVACTVGEAKKADTLLLSPGPEVVIPKGYVLLGVATFGNQKLNVLYFAKEVTTGKTFTLNADGTIREEFIIPEGYSFAGGSAFGEGIPQVLYFCSKDGTQQIFACQPPRQ